MAIRMMVPELIRALTHYAHEKGMSGEIREGMLFQYMEWRVLFKLSYRYLSVEDIIIFDSGHIRYSDLGRDIVTDLFNRLKELDKQFHAYFNAIWC